ncbi:MAG: excisionase family DNA-binding protein [Acidimicrobiia bacterium]|nr:excisionase family DNA-binding protein [Acidimicrobiia bacterium]
MAEDLITTTEAARLLGIPVPRLLDLVIDGSIELQSEGRGVRVRRADVEILIDEIDLRD